MMCRRNLIQPVKRRLLSFTINDYPGSMNDLRGCNRDGQQAKDTLLNFWSDTDIIRFIDSAATTGAFDTNVSRAIKVLSPGATVLVFADSCFSGTITRFAGMGLFTNPFPTQNRLYNTPGVVHQFGIQTFLSRAGIFWIVMSGCGATQYSADAYINGEYHGAFTWYAMNLLEPGITYYEWHERIQKYLPSSQFEQAPTLEGPDYFLNRKVFEDQTLMIQNSTHGTELNGTNGETDQAICLHNGNIRDKYYNSLLIKIPA